jgi:hypothetical protein
VRREEADVLQPQHRRQVADGGRLDVVEAHAVHVVEREPGVVERRADGDPCNLGLGHPEVLGERRLSDADDGGGARLHGT